MNRYDDIATVAKEARLNSTTYGKTVAKEYHSRKTPKKNLSVELRRKIRSCRSVKLRDKYLDLFSKLTTNALSVEDTKVEMMKLERD